MKTKIICIIVLIFTHCLMGAVSYHQGYYEGGKNMLHKITKERKVPCGAKIKLDDNENIIIKGDGSFELKSPTVAMIEYIYEEDSQIK